MTLRCIFFGIGKVIILQISVLFQYLHFLFVRYVFQGVWPSYLTFFQLISLWLFQKPYYQPPNNYIFWSLAMCLVLVFVICVSALLCAYCCLLDLRVSWLFAHGVLMFNEYSFLSTFCLKLFSFPSCYCRFIIFAVSSLHF